MVLPEELKSKFKNFISSRCGLYFKDYDLKGLENAVAKRMASCGLDSALAYYNLLTSSDKKEDEFRELLNLLTINHTYFFRNEPHFTALRDKVLPEIMEKKSKLPKPYLRIWSAGCSTGEEPYSVAMIIRDVIKDIDKWDIQIIATDASTSALEKAKTGVYGENSLRLVNRQYREKYFSQTPDGAPGLYHLAGAIKDMVTFGYFNLMDEDFPGDFDLIFCRNVVIYFELETTVKVMDKFYSSLVDDGCIFIGYSETLQFISEKFKMETSGDAIFYRKIPAGAAGRPSAEGVDQILEEISRLELEAEEKEAAKEKSSLIPKKIEHLIIDSIRYIYEKRYGSALSLIEEALRIDNDALEPRYLAAEVYTNQGRLKEAKEQLKAALKINSLFAPAHYLFGAIYIEEDKLEEAKRSFKKALYLDKDFVLAHFSLANIYKNEGRLKESIRQYRNTLNILAGISLSDIIAYSGGFNAAALTGVCKSNIERLKDISG